MSLEGEALLAGNWKNIEELEECLTLEELELIVKTIREREHRMMKFQAALKGVDLDENDEEETVQEKFERIERRAAAIRAGVSEEEIDALTEKDEFADFGFEVETD